MLTSWLLVISYRFPGLVLSVSASHAALIISTTTMTFQSIFHILLQYHKQDCIPGSNLGILSIILHEVLVSKGDPAKLACDLKKHVKVPQ